MRAYDTRLYDIRLHEATRNATRRDSLAGAELLRSLINMENELRVAANDAEKSLRLRSEALSTRELLGLTLWRQKKSLSVRRWGSADELVMDC